VDCSSTITERRHKSAAADPDAGILLAGISLPGLTVLKLTIEWHWSWWRVFLPLWLVLGHNALYITVGFVWLFFADDGTAEEEVTLRRDRRAYGYQLAAMPCFLIFLDNLLKRIEGPVDSVWFWVSSGRWELIFATGVLSVVCHLVFWSGIVRMDNRRLRRD